MGLVLSGLKMGIKPYMARPTPKAGYAPSLPLAVLGINQLHLIRKCTKVQVISNPVGF